MRQPLNDLRVLDLAGLGQLEGLDAENNRLTSLSLRALRSLRVLNCARNDLCMLDVSGLDLLEVLDCSNNPLGTVDLTGCSSLREARGLPGGSATHLRANKAAAGEERGGALRGSPPLT